MIARLFLLSFIAACGISCTPEPEPRLSDYADHPLYNYASAFLDSGLFRSGEKALIESRATMPSEIVDLVDSKIQLCKILAGDSLRTFSPPTHTIDFLAKAILSTKDGQRSVGSLLYAKNRLAIDRKEKSVYQLFALEYLGLAYQLRESRMDSAMHYFKEAESLARKYKSLEPQLPRLLLHVAELHLINRDAISALSVIEDALRFSIEPDLKIRVFTFAGTIHRRLKHYDQADSFYRNAYMAANSLGQKNLTAFVLREQVLKSIILKDSLFFLQMKEMRSLAESLPEERAHEERLWGYYYFTENNPAASVLHYEKALRLFSHQKLPDPVQVSEARYALVVQYQSLGLFEKAEQQAIESLLYRTPYEQGPGSFSNIFLPEVTRKKFNFINYELLARNYLTQHSHTAQVPLLYRAKKIYQVIDSLMAMQVRVVEEDALIRFLNVSHQVYSGAIETIFHLYRQAPSDQLLEEAHQYMERCKGLLTYKDLLVNNKEYFPSIPDQFRLEELRLKSAIASIKNGSSSNLTELIQQLDQLYESMKEQYPAYYESRFSVVVPTHQHYNDWAQRSGYSIVQYHTTATHLYVITYGNDPVFTRIELPKDFNTEIVALLKQLHNPPSRVAADKTLAISSAKKLYKLLVTPAGKLNEKVIFVPEGMLTQLPFEVLMDPAAEKEKYLIEDHDIRYVHSLKIFNTETQQSRTDRVVAYGFACNQSKPSEGSLPMLRGAGKEMEIIKEKFSKPLVRMCETASKENFIRDIKQPVDILHLALHASSSAANRHDNKLYFTNQDELLYGYELLPLGIDANTVVITSCESAYGPVVAGEGTFSLLRIFKQTGAKHVVGSLWALPDNSSSNLMRHFYTEIKMGHSPATALSKAKQHYLQTADIFTSAPFFWAGLVCY